MRYEAAIAQEILVGIPTNIEAAIPDATGNPKAGLAVTVSVTRADGTALYSGASAIDATEGVYTLALGNPDVAKLDVLVAQWSVAGVVRATTAHEIVGGYYYTESDVEVTEAGRAAGDRPDFATIRREVTIEAERICNVAFVPRYARYTIDGSGFDQLIVPDPMIRTVRDIAFLNGDGTTWTTVDPAEVATIAPHAGGMVIKSRVGSVGAYFPLGAANVRIGYEHGYDRPPADLRRAGMKRHRQRSNKARSQLPDRAVTFTADNGATYRIATADATSTGDPDLDAIYDGYALRRPAFG